MDDEQLRHNYLERKRLAERDQDPVQRPNPLAGLHRLFGDGVDDRYAELAEDRYAEHAPAPATPSEPREFTMGDVGVAMSAAALDLEQSKRVLAILRHLRDERGT